MRMLVTIMPPTQQVGFQGWWVVMVGAPRIASIQARFESDLLAYPHRSTIMPWNFCALISTSKTDLQLPGSTNDLPILAPHSILAFSYRHTHYRPIEHIGRSHTEQPALDQKPSGEVLAHHAIHVDDAGRAAFAHFLLGEFGGLRLDEWSRRAWRAYEAITIFKARTRQATLIAITHFVSHINSPCTL